MVGALDTIKDVAWILGENLFHPATAGTNWSKKIQSSLASTTRQVLLNSMPLIWHGIFS